MTILSLIPLCFSILVGRGASTDGYVYLGHNEDLFGEQMLNIYNVPSGGGRCASLWFEFPGQTAGDSFVNEYGVCIVSDKCRSREDRTVEGSVVYEVRLEVAAKARSAREAVHIIGSMVERYGYGDTGRSYLVADSKEGWVCSVVMGRHWVARRVPDDEIATIPNYYTIGEVDLKDTVNFLGSKDLVRYARRRGWYSPRRDGAFNFRNAYADPSSLSSKSNLERHSLAQNLFFGDFDPDLFSRKPSRKFHRKDISLLLTEPPVRTKNTVLTTVFTMNPAYPPESGTVVWVGMPGQDAANQSQWTIFTQSPESCHRYETAEEAFEKHFSDASDFRSRWPDHFYWHYLYPETDIDVIPHDYTVFVPKQPADEFKRDPAAVGDTFNDHFHVLGDPSGRFLYAFWTQGSHEGADDEHVVFSRSGDGGRSWTDPVIVAGSPSAADPKPVAGWQQPMVSRSGRLYVLWNQETTLKKHLCGIMQGRYSDDCGETWSEPETVPFPIRFDVDPADPTTPPVWCMWQRPLRFGSDGRYIAGCSRYDREGTSRVEFWEYENIDDDPDVRDIKISFFNTREEAFDASKVSTDVSYTPRDGLSIEEACIVGLPDGRLFAVMRSSLGHPVWSVSSDGGHHWSRPEILRESDGGPAILHPRSPCPIYDYEGPEARSGRYFLMVHGCFDFHGLTSYQNRGPLYRMDGRFVAGAHQPVWFTEDPVVFSPRDTGNSFYTSFTSMDGEQVLWFGDKKFYLFGKRMDASCSKVSDDGCEISYRIGFEPKEKYIDVNMTCVPKASLPADEVTFKMPVWAPGYYTIIDYPKYLSDFEARDSQGQPLQWEKSGKNAWKVRKADTILVSYKVFADEMSVADSRVTEEGAFIAPGGVFMNAGIGHPVSIAVDLPGEWNNISTALQFEDGVFKAPDFDVLYDSPMMIGNHYIKTVEQEGHSYEFAVRTPQGFEESGITGDFLAGVREAVRIFGDTPYDSYHLLLLERGPGGLEHQASQADYTAGTWDFRTRGEYLSILRFLTHEFFHCYNVKAIRPIELGPFDYDREVFTPMLWFSEGITCYYESLLLERAGVETEKEHLDFLAGYIRDTETTEGRRHMSMRTSSYDIWLNFFNRSANASDVTISYYVKGPVIGFLMDLEIQRLSGGKKSLDDLMNLLYWRYFREQGRGFTEEEFWAAATEVAGSSLDLIRSYVDTTDEIDYDSILNPAGYSLDRSTWTLR